MRVIIVALFLLLCAKEALAETKIIPIVSYGYMDVREQAESSLVGGLIVQRGEELMVSLIYGNYRYAEPLEFTYPEEFHAINALVDYKFGAHELLAIVKSESADPFENKYTAQAGVVYGYQFIKSERFSFMFGGGLVGGGNYDLLPVPYIVVKYDIDLLSVAFDMITDPSLEVIFLPKNKLNLLLDLCASDFSQVEFLAATAALRYQPAEYAMLSVGVKSDGHAFASTKKDTDFFMHTYSAFAEVDFGLAKLNGGYVFDSSEIYYIDGDVTKRDTGTGYYLSAELMFLF